MTLIIPYTFVAGTKAQSAQVNENFQAVATEVNSIGSDLADAETAITNLTNNKADVNGNTSNRFAVADPVNGNDAVNKQYFNSLAQYILAGLVISKADDEYISCTAGACYDTTGAKILRFASDVSKSEYPYNVNATYYVYIVGMPSGGTNTQLLISTSSSSPALPSGYTLYRGLGNFTTDSSGKIKDVFPIAPLSGSDFYNTPHVTDTYVNGTSWYIVFSNKFCMQGGKVTSGYGEATINLLKSFSNTNYTPVATNVSTGYAAINTVTKTQLGIKRSEVAAIYWVAFGYVS